MAYTKVCKKCLLSKSLDNFRKRKDNDNYRNICKSCEYEQLKLYRENNKDIIKKISKKYYNQNKMEVINKQKNYYQNNKDVIRLRRKEIYNNNKEKFLLQSKIRQRKNRKNITALEIKRLKNDPIFKIKKRIRNLIRDSFTKKGFIKSKKTEDILGCSLNNFYMHMVKTYENIYHEKYDINEKVHIDHITPLATAKTYEDIIKLCHYSNLQLLKAKDNLLKSSKLNWTKGGINNELYQNSMDR